MPAFDRTYVLGEGPHWDADGGRLSWVDIPVGELWASTDNSSKSPHLVHRFQDDLGVAVPHEAGWLCAVGPSLVLLADGQVRSSVQLESAGARLNDGKTDPRGRFWVGSKGHHNEPGRGHLYRLDLDGTATTVLHGLTISNGLGWSPDESTMYVTDSPLGVIRAYDFDASTGDIDNGRALIQLQPGEGAPDGLCVDSEGAIWTALWGGSSVRRYSAAGELLGIVEVAASHVTSCTFVGEHLTTLAITTAKDELEPEVLAGEPFAGSVFLVEVGISGALATSSQVPVANWIFEQS
jgi:sugar lactone lactonase YvrE